MLIGSRPLFLPLRVRHRSIITFTIGIHELLKKRIRGGGGRVGGGSRHPGPVHVFRPGVGGEVEPHPLEDVGVGDGIVGGGKNAGTVK